ncbi:amidohydrolase family protein [Flavobacteriaceae bacterium S0862]|nr:amidohydrolase family protein [Flavobacteriaceae bacterium S0862]
MKKLIGILILSIVIFSCKNEVQISYDLIIENGNVIDIVSGNISKQTIFINEGRIVKLANSDDKNTYNSEIVLDGTNKFILPGFWDNHVHFRGGDSLIQANKDFLKLFIMNGVTTVRDAGGDLTTSVMDWKQKINNKDLVGPNIFSAGPKIDGKNATWAGSLVVENNEDISIALDSLQALNVDFVKLYDSRISGELYLKTIQEATKRGLITSGHMPFSVTLNETLDVGIDGIEHLYYVLKGCSSNEKEITEAIKNGEYGFWASMEKLIETYQDSTAQKTFESLNNKNTFVVPTLHIGNVLSYLDEDNHENDAYLKLIPSGIIETYQGRIRSSLNSSNQARQNRKELNTFFKNFAKSLSDADVKLLAGSDSGAFNSYTYPGISLHKELESMVNIGISNLKALQNSAYNGALFLKKESDYGSIGIGKISDLVMLNSNPLEDITNTRDINYVIKGNEVFNPEIMAMVIDCTDCIK